ncbi:FUSC family protein [Vibrio alfacsensis]|uniref:FUSC family protein n=1 Tax=Vibrio alfacsensis TaxID=1074311 RepID=UPI00406850E4
MNVHLRLSIRYMLMGLITFTLGYYINLWIYPSTALLGGMWSVISGVIVIEADSWKQNLSTAKNRLIGSFIGGVIATIYLGFIPFHIISFALLIGLTVFVCSLFHVTQHIKLACVTFSVIIIVSTMSDVNPFQNASMRFLESGIGIASALLVSKLMSFFPASTK